MLIFFVVFKQILSIAKKILTEISPAIIIAFAIFFYTFNLKNTYWFAADMARDTLKSLRILKTHELTLIGPPLSFGQYGTREIYFGSLSYYFGALGLATTSNNPLGPIYVNTALMIFGIIFFYKTSLLYFKNKGQTIFATAIYAFSPLIVSHLRFYWNPNFIISLSPVFWYLYLKTKENKNILNPLLTGFIGAVLFNLHYFVLPIIIGCFVFIFTRQTKIKSLAFLIGFTVGISPLIFFELKHEFYLLNAVMHNFFVQPISNAPQNLNLIERISIIVRPSLMILGVDYDVNRIPVYLNFNVYLKLLLGLSIYLFLAIQAKVQKISLDKDLVAFIALGVGLVAVFSKEAVYIRYFFICIPIATILIVKLLPKNNFLKIAIIFNLLLVSTRILTFQQHSLREFRYPTISTMERAAKIVRSLQPNGKYNVSENFLGDARALYFRFFIEREPDILPPENEVTYEGLNRLFVLAPNEEIIIKSNRWEFTATPNLVKKSVFTIDSTTKLYMYQAE